MSKNKINLILVGVVALGFALGCSQIKERFSQSNNVPPTPGKSPLVEATPRTEQTPRTGDPTNSGGKLFEPGALDDFIAELKKVRGDKIRVLQLSVYKDYAMIQVQDPNKKENVDGFTWRGGSLSEPAPVRLIGGGDLEQNLFNLDDVATSKIPDLINEAREKTKDMEGAEDPTYVLIKRNLPFKKDVQMSVYVTGSRKSARMVADQTGKVTEFTIN